MARIKYYDSKAEKWKYADALFAVGDGNNPGGNVDQSGLSTTAANLLITILREGVYNSDQSANITALAAELSVTESGGDGEENPTITISVDDFAVYGISEGYPYYRVRSDRTAYVGTAVPATAGKAYLVTPVYSVTDHGLRFGVQYAKKEIVDAQGALTDDFTKIDSGWITTETYEVTPTFDSYIWICFNSGTAAEKLVSVTVEEVS